MCVCVCWCAKYECLASLSLSLSLSNLCASSWTAGNLFTLCAEGLSISWPELRYSLCEIPITCDRTWSNYGRCEWFLWTQGCQYLGLNCAIVYSAETIAQSLSRVIGHGPTMVAVNGFFGPSFGLWRVHAH
jgi:hypothetical protein